MILHVLRDFQFAQGFWNSFPPPLQGSLFYGVGVADWMRLNCRSTIRTSSLCITWGSIFPFGLWGLWLHRNNLVFGRGAVRTDLKKDVVAKATEYPLLGVNARVKGIHTTIQLAASSRELG